MYWRYRLPEESQARTVRSMRGRGGSPLILDTIDRASGDGGDGKHDGGSEGRYPSLGGLTVMMRGITVEQGTD